MNNLVEKYLSEVRSRKLVSKKKLMSDLRDIYIKHNRRSDPSMNYLYAKDAIRDRYSSMGYNIVSLDLTTSDKFPGIKVRGRSVDTRDFENRYLKGTGWFVSSSKVIDRDITVQLVPSEKADKPEELYHATHVRNSASINLEGLKPKARDSDGKYMYRQGRIYLLDEFDSYSFQQLILLIEADRQGIEIGDEEFQQLDPSFVVYEIRQDVFNKFNVYRDNDTSGYYTLTHIPAKALKKVYYYEGHDW